MKFKNYLIEQWVSQIVKEELMTQKEFDKFFQDCKSFINEVCKMDYPREPLFRGVGRDTGMGKWTIKNSHLKDREPMNTDIQVHRLLNDAFEDRFGWKVRNGVFTTSDDKDARRYGHLFYVFPAGDFKFVWSSKMSDLYTDLDVKFNVKNIAGARKVVDMYQDTDLEAAMKSGHEIMFKCERYYLFDVDYT